MDELCNSVNGDSSNPRHHAMAGGITGLIEYSIMYPIDLIKTRMQVLKPHPEARYRNILSCIISIIKDEGAYKLYKGMPAPLIASIPAHASYYVTYEKLKRVLSDTEGGYYSPLAQGIAGAMAIMSHNIISNPADVIKQRMQIYNSPHRSTFRCFKSVLGSEGYRAFYRSLPTQMAIDVPYGSIHFVTYEYCQNVLNPTRKFNAWSHILSGAIAGGIAAATTTPLDVCRTLINTQEIAVVSESHKGVVRGLCAAVGIVYKTHGISGFFRGLIPRVMHHVPYVSICWIVYEFLKRYFKMKDMK